MCQELSPGRSRDIVEDLEIFDSQVDGTDNVGTVRWEYDNVCGDAFKLKRDFVRTASLKL